LLPVSRNKSDFGLGFVGLDDGICVFVDSGIENQTTELVTVRRDIGAAASKAESQRGAGADQHLLGSKGEYKTAAATSMAMPIIRYLKLIMGVAAVFMFGLLSWLLAVFSAVRGVARAGYSSAQCVSGRCLQWGRFSPHGRA
jgi:hypothetical protein